MICLEEFAGRVVQDFGHQPLQKKFEVRFYVCVDVEMLIRHPLKNLMERDRDGMIRQIYSVFTKVVVELVELVETCR